MTTALSPGELRSPKEKAIDAEILARVKRGIELLNERYGPDWVNRIDLPELELASLDRCVLGQVYGSWGKGLGVLGIDGGEAGARYGFDRAGCAFIEHDVAERQYAELNDAWRTVLTPKVTVAE